MQAHACDVDTVIVGGNILQRKGHVLADVGKAKSVLREASERISRKVADSGTYRVYKGRVGLF